jgi:hypothetical protein
LPSSRAKKSAKRRRVAVESAKRRRVAVESATRSSVLALRKDLRRLDQEWVEREESYMETTRFGRRHLPSPEVMKATSAFMGLFALYVAFAGLGGISRLEDVLSFNGFIWLGLVCAGIAGSVSGFRKARRYEGAKMAMARERAVLVAQIEAVEQHRAG